MGVKFQSDQCFQALQKHMISAVKEMQRVYIDEIVSGMNTPEGRQGLSEGEVNVVATYITGTILGDGWALMDSYGSGSKMLTDHPGYYEYRGSSYWNPDRRDTAIRTWSKENAAKQEVNILGKKIRGSNVGGINLEGKKIRGEVVEPIEPSRAIETATRWMRESRIKNILKEFVAIFPFHKFIITK